LGKWEGRGREGERGQKVDRERERGRCMVGRGKLKVLLLHKNTTTQQVDTLIFFRKKICRK
jgi:hypothetical protein